VYPGLDEAADAIVATAARCAPDADVSRAYGTHYQRYLQVSNGLLDLFDRL